MYSVETAEEALLAIEALPREALIAYAELMVVLETSPLNGRLTSPHRPSANFRAMPFGQDMNGMVIYFVLEDQRRVSVVRVLWAG